MMTQDDKDRMVGSVTIPELRSSVQRLLDSMDSDPEASGSYRLTLLALLSFYRKNMQSEPSIETDNNILKSRLIESGVLYFGPLYQDSHNDLSRARILKILNELGFCTEHLVFMNATQIELFFTYIRETGLIHNGH